MARVPPEELEPRLVEALEGSGATGLRDLVDALDADAGSVFLCVRRLEDRGAVASPRPGAYELAEGAVDAIDRGDASIAHADPEGESGES